MCDKIMGKIDSNTLMTNKTIKENHDAVKEDVKSAKDDLTKSI